MSKFPFTSDTGFFAISRTLVAEFAAEKELDTAELKNATIRDFHEWCFLRSQLGKSISIDNEADVSTAADNLLPQRHTDENLSSVSEQTYRMFVRCLADPIVFVSLMLDWWPVLVIKSPPPRCAVDEISLDLSISFTDGRTLKIHHPLPMSTWLEGTGQTEGSVFAAIRVLSQALLKSIIACGLDDLHKQVCGEPAWSENPHEFSAGEFGLPQRYIRG